MDMFPANIKDGKPARLFSSLKISNKEQIATSTLLAVFRIIPELLADLLSQTEVRFRDRTDVKVYTEITLSKSLDDKNNRPDGLICIKNKNEWRALVESKVGTNQLDASQIERYMKDAKENDINALITISNEFTSTIKQSPLKTLSKRQLSKVNLYHFSWRLILSTAMLLKNNDEIKDREKSLVLDELIRFLKDDSVGTKSFTQMPASWINVISSEQGFKKNDHEVIEIADALIEEFSEIAINLQDHLGVDCNVKLKSRFKGDRNAWQEDISKSIAEKKIADCFFSIPDAADDLILHIDLKGSKMSVGMEIKAPDERTTTKGKTNWLLNQLKKKSDDKPFDESNSFVQIRWKSKTTKTEVKLSELIEDKEKCFSDSNGTIASFTPMMRVHSTKIFKSRKKFIDELEKLVEGFYDHYGQYLKQPQPKAPKPIEASSYDIDLTSE